MASTGTICRVARLCNLANIALSRFADLGTKIASTSFLHGTAAMAQCEYMCFFFASYSFFVLVSKKDWFVLLAMTPPKFYFPVDVTIDEDSGISCCVCRWVLGISLHKRKCFKNKLKAFEKFKQTRIRKIRRIHTYKTEYSGL